MKTVLNELRNQLIEYEILTITKQNFQQVFEVYESNHEFFLLTQGKKATIEQSICDIDALPPNCDIDQKIYISIWEDGRAVGVLDLIMNYPEQSGLWIGLLLISSNLHGRKIGSRLVSAVLSAAKDVGHDFAQLGVIESNTKGISFWQKQGFEASRRNGNIVVMTRRI